MARRIFQSLDNEYFSEKDGYTLGIHVPITQSQFDALVDLSYNAGGSIALDAVTRSIVSTNGNPTLNTDRLKTILTVELSSPGGIAKRRNQEWNMFFYGIYDSTH